jgi:hypothetical protein
MRYRSRIPPDIFAGLFTVRIERHERVRIDYYEVFVGRSHVLDLELKEGRPGRRGL